MATQGLSERRALTVVRMSASALRYVPRPDPDPSLRDRIVALAHRHRRYGAGMIYLKLRQEGRVVNHKRVDRLYAEARLQVKRRRRKKVPVVDRQPLFRPEVPNEVWSADFVFDRTAEGRVLKCLTIVDDATTEAVAVVPARALGGLPVTRILDRLAGERGLPGVLRTDNALEFCGRAMLTWAHTRGVTLRLIEPASRIRTRISNRSTGACGMNVSTSTGSPAWRMPRSSLRPGGESTTRNGRKRDLAGSRPLRTLGN
jgi:putative transposase